jgi:hypothetical protein
VDVMALSYIDFHWIGETLMAKDFGEVVEICSVDWSGLDEFEAEHKALIAAAPDLLAALARCLNFIEYTESEIGETLECGDKARAALAKARGDT